MVPNEERHFDDFGVLDAHATGKPFSGTILLEFSVGRDFGGSNKGLEEHYRSEREKWPKIAPSIESTVGTYVSHR